MFFLFVLVSTDIPRGVWKKSERFMVSQENESDKLRRKFLKRLSNMNKNERSGIQIWTDFRALKAAKQVAILLDAMEYMDKFGLPQTDCLAHAMGYTKEDHLFYTKGTAVTNI